MTDTDIPRASRDQDAESVRAEIMRLRIALGYIRRLAQSDIDGAAEGIQTAEIEMIARRALKDDTP